MTARIRNKRSPPPPPPPSSPSSTLPPPPPFLCINTSMTVVLMNMITPTICLLGMAFHWAAHIGVGKWVILQLAYLYLSQPSLTCVLWLSDRSLSQMLSRSHFHHVLWSFSFCSFINHDVNLINYWLACVCVTLICKSSSFCTVGQLCHYQ